MPYRVELSPAARRALGKLDAGTRERILRSLITLESDPRPSGAKKLKGEDGYRFRVGDYRILYEIRDDRLLVLVIKVGHRRDVYRRR